jgi:hypothetical protein
MFPTQTEIGRSIITLTNMQRIALKENKTYNTNKWKSSADENIY